MRYLPVLLSLFLAAASGELHAVDKADSVLVVKSERKLYLVRDEKPYASFSVTFGSNPKGHKQKQGDGRTPEGLYVLDYKNATSNYYRSIHISYPNDEDRSNARSLGISPGGDIMIHGQKNGFAWLGPLSGFVNWTDGCIAVRDREMDLLWEAIDPGTPIEIRP